MAGICGWAFRENNAKLDAAHLEPMIQALSMGSEGCRSVLCLGRVVLGAQVFQSNLAGVAQLARGDASLGLALYGSLYNLKELGCSGHGQSEILAELLRLYVKRGMTFVNALRGEFALAL